MLSRLRTAMRRADRHDRGGDAGFTLIEMIVTISVLSVVGTMLSTWFIAGIDTTAKNTARLNDENAAHGAIEQLTDDIQLATPNPNSTTAGPFAAGTHDSLTIYAQINGSTTPAMITWAVTGSGGYNGSLVRTVYLGTSSGGTVTWASTGTAKTELTGVYDVTGKVPPIFRFLDAADAADNQMCADTGAASPCATPLASSTASVDPTTTQIPNAVGVEVYLQVASGGDGASASASPYYESSKKTGIPYVIRTRIYPQSNTIAD